MFKAKHIRGNDWLVHEIDESGDTVWKGQVVVKQGGTAKDAVAVITDLRRGPSAGQKAAQDAKYRSMTIQDDCERRILRVLSLTTQANLLSKAHFRELTPAQTATFRAGLAWKDAMITACRAMIPDRARDYTDDAQWPDVPADVAELAAQF